MQDIALKLQVSIRLHLYCNHSTAGIKEIFNQLGIKIQEWLRLGTFKKLTTLDVKKASD